MVAVPDRSVATRTRFTQPAEAIVQVAEQERADIIVVGNVSMGERTEFLLGSVPNRVSHTAPCTVVIVDTRPRDPSSTRGPGAVRSDGKATDSEATDGELLRRAAQIAAVLANYGLGNVAHRRDPGPSDAARPKRFPLDVPSDLQRAVDAACS